MMPNEMKNKQFYVGIKQSTEAIAKGIAQKAYIAENADEYVKAPFLELCKEHGVPTETVPTKQQLGKMCAISVGASCAVVLKS